MGLILTNFIEAINFRMSLENIFDQPLSQGKNSVSLAAFTLLFSEVIKYYQQDVNSYEELEQKLTKFGKSIGHKLADIITIRERTKIGTSLGVNSLTQVNPSKLTRETGLLNMLLFIKSVVWKSLFGKDADKLEKSADETETYYIIDSEPLIATFVSGDDNFNVMAFAAGIVEAILEGANFPSDITAHHHKGTTLMIKFKHV